MSGPLRARGPTRGMVEDFETVERIVRERVVDALDHQNLNDFIDNPTAERTLLWMWKQLDGALRGLDELTLWETATACAVLRKSDVRRRR